MDIELLKTFIEVANVRHFGKAAEQLFLTRSAVSFRIKQLESELGVKLFIRYRHNIQLTHEGEQMLPHAQTILSAWWAAKHQLAQTAPSIKPLTFAYEANLWEIFLKWHTQEIYQVLGENTINTKMMAGSAIARQLADNKLDFAFSFVPIQSDSVTSIKLTNIDLGIVSSAGKLLETELATVCFAQFNWQPAKQEEAKLKHLLPKAFMQSDNFTQVLDVLLARPGISLLPIEPLNHLLQTQQLFLVTSPVPLTAELYFTYPHNTNYQRVFEQLIAALSPRN